MSRAFSQSTAEQLIAAVNAVVANNVPTTPDLVAVFADIPRTQALAALELALDVGLLSENAGLFIVKNPLCRFFSTPNVQQKAAMLRVVLEFYDVFCVFRTRLEATDDTASAAQETRALLDLSAHRDEIKDTLLSLGTFSRCLTVESGGRYKIHNLAIDNDLEVLAQACDNSTSAEARIRRQIGNDAACIVSVADVISPLGIGLLHAVSGESRAAVVHAGNAVESYLVELAARLGVSLAGKNGVNSKLNELKSIGNLPAKLQNVGFYLGHIRNAADHGIDSDVSATWTIRHATGIEYVYVACSFIAAVTAWEHNKPVEI